MAREEPTRRLTVFLPYPVVSRVYFLARLCAPKQFEFGLEPIAQIRTWFVRFGAWNRPGVQLASKIQKVVSSNLPPQPFLIGSQELVGFRQQALLLFGKDLGRTYS